jgi:hypothetical protein
MACFYILGVAATRLSKSLITILFGVNMRTAPTHSLRHGLHGRIVGNSAVSAQPALDPPKCPGCRFYVERRDKPACCRGCKSPTGKE